MEVSSDWILGVSPEEVHCETSGPSRNLVARERGGWTTTTEHMNGKRAQHQKGGGKEVNFSPSIHHPGSRHSIPIASHGIVVVVLWPSHPI